MQPNGIGYPAKNSSGKRILFATFGSLGDMHPCLALAQELERRGHRVTFATTAYYRARVEALGLKFRPLRPDLDPTSREMIAQCADLKSGPEVLFRKIVLPHLDETYTDLLQAAAEADLLLAGEMNFPAPLVSEKLALPWISIVLSPASFLSARDPSVTVNVPWLFSLRRLGWPVYRAVLSLGRLSIRHWWTPVRQLRRREGLRVACDPLFRDKFSPLLVLALFSPLLGRKQADWPKQTYQPGFVFFDGGLRRKDLDPSQNKVAEDLRLPAQGRSLWTSVENAPLSEGDRKIHPLPSFIFGTSQMNNTTTKSHGLAAFLAEGEAPILFTQGSTAVHNPGDFFAVSAETTMRMGRRALLVGADPQNVPASQSLLAIPYASYAEIFPRASVIVHQGGSGTTGEAMRAGRPMLIVPYGWDQPDNAMRVERLGMGLSIPRKGYNATTAETALIQLLQPKFSERARQVAEQMKAEDGLAAACDQIEAALVEAVLGRAAV